MHLRFFNRCDRVPTNGVQQLVHSAPRSKKRWSYVAVTLKTKCKSTIPREFPGYWWQFRTQNFSRCSARLVEAGAHRARKGACNSNRARFAGSISSCWRKKEERRWKILIFGHFKFAPLKWLLYVAITTVEWGKLLWVLLDASICSPAMISPWKR